MQAFYFLALYFSTKQLWAFPRQCLNTSSNSLYFTFFLHFYPCPYFWRFSQPHFQTPSTSIASNILAGLHKSLLLPYLAWPWGLARTVFQDMNQPHILLQVCISTTRVKFLYCMFDLNLHFGILLSDLHSTLVCTLGDFHLWRCREIERKWSGVRAIMIIIIRSHHKEETNRNQWPPLHSCFYSCFLPPKL